MPSDLAAEAKLGFDAAKGTECPFYATSDSAAAWEIGRTFKEMGWPAPAVRPSRGYRYHASGKIVKVTWHPKKSVTVEIGDR